MTYNILLSKTFIVAISVIVAFHSAFTQYTSDLSRQNLMGKVRTALRSNYEPKNNSERFKEKDLKDKTLYEFNEQGNLIQMRVYNHINLLTFRYSYIYDSEGKRIVAFKYNSEENLVSVDSSQYDLNGNRTLEKKYTTKDSLQSIDHYSYDSKGRIIEMMRKNILNKMLFRYRFKYHNNAMYTHSDYHGQDSSQLEIYTYKFEHFDKEGNFRKAVIYRDNDVYRISKFSIAYY
ncbi:hypothetical protein EXU57_24800 [Segetibacter sp. 3557_3]|uniref:hypothetical protein n=1 Tax=Segetibacter sp. 3557_3 TaxID=2547429 RepID=UPI00105860A4|nr:hypothetical protein [Segetibacter sp. 3557_3]TDH17811.1 hypothetical protein EXU57_24800 [Segetibacter sp. 3557_3]